LLDRNSRRARRRTGTRCSGESTEVAENNGKKKQTGKVDDFSSGILLPLLTHGRGK
jgi:hypothetical protein